MALVLTGTNALEDQNAHYLTRKITVTGTGDNSAVASAVTGLAHGGPAGVTPTVEACYPITDSSTGGELGSLYITNFDTDNDEVDFKLVTAAAIANTETMVWEVVLKFKAQTAQDGSSITSSAVY